MTSKNDFFNRLGAAILVSSTFLGFADNADAQKFDPDKLEELSLRFKKQRESDVEKTAKWKLRNRSHPVFHKLPEVRYFEGDRPMFYGDANVTAAATISTSRITAAADRNGFNLTGSGRLIGMWESGVPKTGHIEFSVIGSPNRISTSLGTNTDHATLVAGTMAAAGLLDPDVRGMAPSANIFAWDTNNEIAEMTAAAAPSPSPIPNPLRLSNHSYQEYCGWTEIDGDWFWFGDTSIDQQQSSFFGWYNSRSASYDEIAFNAPYYTMIFGAGNQTGDSYAGPTHYHENASGVITTETDLHDANGVSGFDTMPLTATAKNIITVGAVNAISGGYTGPASVVGATYSGHGPTDDGRIKPDIVTAGQHIPGEGLKSTMMSGTANYSGTSAATPGATGSVALLQQFYQRLNPGSELTSASVKALLVQTADEAGASNGPDYNFGWGLMNTEQAAKIINLDELNGAASIVQNEVIGDVTGGTTDTLHSYSFVSDGNPIKATLVWTDPAASARVAANMSSPVLVHDLDLRIRKSDGSVVHSPWVLDPAFPAAAATKGDNFRDNVEKVEADTMVAGGIYYIDVTYKGTLPATGQAYSLVVSDVPRNQAWSDKFTGGITQYISFVGSAVDGFGNTYYIGNFNHPTEGSEILIIKKGIDGRNSPSWPDTGNGVGVKVIRGGTAVQDAAYATNFTNGYLYLAGVYGSQKAVLKIDSGSGQFSTTWADTGAGAGVRLLTGEPWILKVDSSNNVFVAGKGVLGSYPKMWVTKLNTSGSQIWNNTIAGPTATTYDNVTALAIDNSGNVLVAGSTDAVGNWIQTSFFTVKFLSTGVEDWRKTYDSGASTQDIPSDAGFDPLGFAYVTGTLDGNLGTPSVYTIKYSTNTSGSVVWQKKYVDGVRAGRMELRDTTAGLEIWHMLTTSTDQRIVKFNASGNYVTHIAVGTTTGASVFFRESTTLYVATRGTSNTIAVKKIDASGVPLTLTWERRLGSPTYMVNALYPSRLAKGLFGIVVMGYGDYEIFGARYYE